MTGLHPNKKKITDTMSATVENTKNNQVTGFILISGLQFQPYFKIRYGTELLIGLQCQQFCRPGSITHQKQPLWLGQHPLYSFYFHHQVFSVGTGRRLVTRLVHPIQYFLGYQQSGQGSQRIGFRAAHISGH